MDVKVTWIEKNADDVGNAPHSSDKTASDTWGSSAVEPPVSMAFLADLINYGTVLQSCVTAMEVNIEGFGHRLVPLFQDDEINAKEQTELKQERTAIDNFLVTASSEGSLITLRRKLRRDMELTGNAYIELIRSIDGLPEQLIHVNPVNVKLTKQNEEFVKIDHYALITVEGRPKVKKYTRWRKPRMYVQATQNHKVYFKQYGDSRFIHQADGTVSNSPLKPEDAASEMLHLKIYDSSTPYGMPRYYGGLLKLMGNREADEVNYTTLKHNNIPSMILTVSGGTLTKATVDRIKQFINKQVSGKQNYSAVLVLEATAPTESIGGPNKPVKIDVNPLVNIQTRDQMFKEYMTTNYERIRESFRLPPIFIGRSQDYTRSTADSSRRLADEQVFGPERDEMDRVINSLMYEFDMHWHVFKSNSPNITDDDHLLRLLTAAEKAGGMTPRVASGIVNDVLGREVMIKFSPEVDPDQPFSLQMAERVKNMALANEPSQQVTAVKSMEHDLLADSLNAAVEQLYSMLGGDDGES